MAGVSSLWERTLNSTPDSDGTPLVAVAAVDVDVVGSEEPTSAWRAYLAAMGPGLVTGASDDDPSGIATYAQTGAKFGFSMLWVALLTFPLMAAVQEICDRTALASGKGLGELIAVRFNRFWRTVIGVFVVGLCVANALNIAADLVAVGAGMHLVHAGPTTLWAVIAGALVIVLLVSGSFALIARVFKVLAVALLAYIAVLFAVHLDWGAAATRTFIPHVQWSRAYIGLLVAVLGTTISPYLFFWQTMHRVEDMREEPAGGQRALPLRRRRRIDAQRKLHTSRFDVFSGMAFSNIVMFAIIAATAATLFSKGQHDVATADQAAAALKPIAGRFASELFALGFIGSGMLAVPVLAGAGSAGLAGMLGKPTGFSNKPTQAPVFYGLVAVGTLGGMALSLAGLDPIHLLVFVAIVNGVAAAPFLLVTLLIAGNRNIMGTYTNGRLSNFLGWTTFAIMTAAAIALFATSASGG